MSLLFHDVYRRDPSESGFSSPAADRYKLSIEQFKRQLDGVAKARPDKPMLATDVAQAAYGDHFPFLITVDDGGVSYHAVMADLLEARGWRGHVFISTNFIGQPRFLTPAEIRELDSRGHMIGSHSASHPARFSSCRRSEMVEEWTMSKRVLEDIVGREITIASVPGGYFSNAVGETAAEAGYDALFTSEPVTRTHSEGACSLAGRFAVRAGVDADFSRRLVDRSHWTRSEEWASWQVKGLLKPMLGPFYSRLADRIAPFLRT